MELLLARLGSSGQLKLLELMRARMRMMRFVIGWEITFVIHVMMMSYGVARRRLIDMTENKCCE